MDGNGLAPQNCTLQTHLQFHNNDSLMWKQRGTSAKSENRLRIRGFRRLKGGLGLGFKGKSFWANG